MDLLLNRLLQMDKKYKRNLEKLEALFRTTRQQIELKALTRDDHLPEVSAIQPREESQSKSRDFEHIVAKYEQMIRSKNDEYEGMLARLRAKEREHQ